MNILVKSHPHALKKIANGVLLASLFVLVFQILTTGMFLSESTNSEEFRFFLFLIGCGLGLVIAAIEYCAFEAAKNQWSEFTKEGLSREEKGILAIIVLLIAVVLFIDAYTTTEGAIAVGLGDFVSIAWGVGQLFAFEFLFNMYFFLRDQAASLEKG